MSKSIINDDDEYCFICKKRNLQIKGTDIHHMVFGSSKRKLADKFGLTCHLCHYHHMLLHQQGIYKKDLQKIAEQAWLDYYNKTIEDWIKVFGKNYLD